VRGNPDRQGKDEQRGDRRADEDRPGDDPAHAQDEDRHGGDGDDDGDVHHPLDDDRAERRRPAQSLPIAEVVTAHQLTEAGRQDVVGQVADQQVRQHGPEADRRDRAQQALPADRAEEDVDDEEPERHHQPAGLGAGDDVDRRREVDRPDDEGDRERGDRDPDDAAQDRRPAQAVHPPRSGRRATSFGDRRTRSRWRR
jgi:hypothetical protein